jgi:mono/diheme cytochrome c family protein
MTRHLVPAGPRHRSQRLATTRNIPTIAGALGFCLLGAAHPGDDKIPDLKDPEVISAGRELFLEKHCSHCHGADGNGGVNLTDRDLSNPTYVFEAIAEGQERGTLRMPAWRDVLSEAEIWQATAYVISISHNSK